MTRFEKRLGHCYELAGMRILDGDESESIVHGTIQGGGNTPRPHAWVMLPNGDVWEPVTERVLPRPLFEYEYSARIDVIYTRQQFGAAAACAGHWGPYHSTPGAST